MKRFVLELKTHSRSQVALCEEDLFWKVMSPGVFHQQATIYAPK